MVFIETKLVGAFIIQAEKKEDHRGFFARTWCQREFEAHGLESRLVQSSVSLSRKKGTLRGMHYQIPPYEETKLVRCLSGAIYDTIIDLRPLSSTFKQHLSVVLSAENYQMLYVPKGFAHGLQTLQDNTEVLYQMSEFYSPEHARGVRWNDPAFGIQWPEAERTITERDHSYPDFEL
jgi:dTDP-4-dehydrorhamnose 3,5-epimerase